MKEARQLFLILPIFQQTCFFYQQDSDSFTSVVKKTTPYVKKEITYHDTILYFCQLQLTTLFWVLQKINTYTYLLDKFFGHSPAIPSVLSPGIFLFGLNRSDQGDLKKQSIYVC